MVSPLMIEPGAQAAPASQAARLDISLAQTLYYTLHYEASVSAKRVRCPG
jgi:hypothetical protein